MYRRTVHTVYYISNFCRYDYVSYDLLRMDPDLFLEGLYEQLLIEQFGKPKFEDATVDWRKNPNPYQAK